jgi:hypothetical protein
MQFRCLTAYLYNSNGTNDFKVVATAGANLDFLPPYNFDYYSLFPIVSVNNNNQSVFLGFEEDLEFDIFNGFYYILGDFNLITATAPIPNVDQSFNETLAFTPSIERPLIADNGNVIVTQRGSQGSSERILNLYNNDLDLIQTIAATGPNFSQLGTSPGISDDGQVVTFYGDLSVPGAATLGLSPGPGIFASIDTTSGRKIQRVAGIAGNGFLDPGETFDDVNGNSIFDVGEIDIGPFSSFGSNSRVGVNSVGNAYDANVAYIAFDNSGNEGVYTSRISLLDPQNLTFAVSEPRSVIKVGDAFPNTTSIVQDVEIYDPINTLGQVAFWANTTVGEVVSVAKPPGVVVEKSWGTVQDGSITFKVRLTDSLADDLILNFRTVDGSANSGGLQNEKQDFTGITAGTLTFKAGNLTPEEGDITISLLDNEISVTDTQFEFFARNTAYKDWNQKRADIDIVSDKPPEITDLGYRVDKFFNDPSTDFQTVGLTSDENFYLVLSAQNQNVFVNPQLSTSPFLKTLSDDLGGDTNSQAYTNAQQLVSQLSASGGSWTFSKGTVYDKNRPPVLAVRGTASLLDIWDDSNPNGVGYEQFQANFGSVSTWLQKASHPEKYQNGTPLNLKPHITGHSLGGALAQWIAGEYLANTDSSFALADIVAFNTPAISEAGANKIDLSRVDSVTLNIMSADLVSLAGNDYLTGSNVNLWDYSLGILGQGSVFDFFGGDRGVFNTHSAPMYLTENGTLAQPSPLSKTTISSSQASDFFFTYFPDLDYFALVTAVTIITNIVPLPELFGIPNELIGPALTFRGTTEFGRRNLGENLRIILESVETIQSAWQAGVNAYNSAVNYGTAAWQTLIDQAKSVLQIFESSTQTVPSSISGSSDLDSAFLLAQSYLTQFANSVTFGNDMVTAFGGELDAQVVNNLRQQWLAGDFSKLPTIQIVPSAQIGGKNGAFTALGEIYIADTFLNQNLNNVDAVVSVLIEEIGHWVDTQVHSFDAPGDEGEIFASVVQGITLSPQQLQALKNENDFVILSLEQPTSFNETVIDNFWKAIKFFSPEAWQALGSYPDEAWIAMRSWGETGWSAVSQWSPENWTASKQLTSAQWQATEQFTENDWNNVLQASPNTQPLAANVTPTTNEDTSVIINILANASDPDGDPLTLTLATLPTNGTALVNDNATPADPGDDFVTYTPTLNFNGTDSFTYTVNDGKGGTATATVTMTVTPVNDPPTLAAAIPNQTATELLPFTYTVADTSFNDVDTGDSLTYSATLTSGNPLPTWLTFDASNRSFSGTPGAPDVGSLDIKITAIDSQGATADDDFTLQVVSINKVLGSSTSETLPGTASSDLMEGHEGRDTLDAGPGDDILIGGPGSDTLTGGAGRDYFVYTNINERTDRITDFTPNEDLLDLRGLFNSMGYTGTDPIADGYLLIAASGSGSSVRIDVDGPIGPAAFRTLVTLDAIAPAALTPSQYLI